MPGIKLATAYYELIPSMGGNQSAISKEMGAAGSASGASFGKSFAGGLKGPVAAAGIAAVAAGAVSLLKGAVAEARDSQKVGALTTNVIKQTGGAANVTASQVGRLAEAMSRKTGIDDESIQTGANMLLTFKNVANEAGKGNKVFDQATKAAVDLSAAGFGSIESASVMLGKALNDPIKGMSALGKSGVTFTESQKAQVEQMVKAGDMLGAQKVILGEVNSQVGGAAAAQATAADKMKVAWGAFQEKIGAALLPSIDALFVVLGKVINFLASHQSVMVAIGAALGVVLVGALVAATTAAWGFTGALLANPVTWIVVGIVALIAAIVLLVKHWDTIKAKTIEAWDAIKAKLAEAWDAIKAKLAEAWDGIKTKTSDGVAAVVQFFKDLPGKILATLGAAKTWLVGVGEDIINGLIRGIGNGFQWVKDKITQLGGNMIDWAKQILQIGSPSKVFMAIGQDVALGMAIGVEGGAPRVNAAVAGLTGANVALAGSVAASPAASAADRPIYMDGSIVGVLRELADSRAQLVLNTALVEALA